MPKYAFFARPNIFYGHHEDEWQQVIVCDSSGQLFELKNRKFEALCLAYEDTFTAFKNVLIENNYSFCASLTSVEGWHYQNEDDNDLFLDLDGSIRIFLNLGLSIRNL